MAFLLLAPLIMMGQEMLLSQSGMYVHPGTTLQIIGDVQWNISTGSQVINDGRIEFRDAAILVEAPGAPVTGIGTEHSWMDAMPVNGFDPGGLGLELTSAGPVGPLEIVRGHQPLIMPNDQESVARWFRFADGMPLALENLVFHFDLTELNGLEQTQLDLHDSETGSGPWVPMLATLGSDQLSLLAYGVVPREYLTAFHADAATAVPSHISDLLFEVWPSITSDLVNLRSPEGTPIDQVEILDMRGRRLPVHMQGSLGGHQLTLDLSTYGNGPLLLRVNGERTFKLIKA